MNLQNNLKKYLEFCKYRKELSPKTIKAYRIDLPMMFLVVAIAIYYMVVTALILKEKFCCWLIL